MPIARRKRRLAAKPQPSPSMRSRFSSTNSKPVPRQSPAISNSRPASPDSCIRIETCRGRHLPRLFLWPSADLVRAFGQEDRIEALIHPPTLGRAPPEVMISAPHRIDLALIGIKPFVDGIIMRPALSRIAVDRDTEIHHIVMGRAAVGALAQIGVHRRDQR